MNERITEPKFKHRLLTNFFVRFHMTLILGAVCFSGTITSKLLLMFGVRLMPVRYLIAVCIAYAIFFLLMRLWLWYIGISPRTRKLVSQSQNRQSQSGSIGDGIYLDIGPVGNSSSSDWGGFGGGSSGGGGASDSWAETASSSTWLGDSANPAPPSGGGNFSFGSSSGQSGGGGFDLDLGDDGCLAIVVLLLLIALVLGIFGAGAYLIYQAPAIFAETAFQAALASGLIKASKDMDATDWKGSVFKATWLPFVVVLVLALAFSIAAHRYCPKATKATEVFKACKQW
ncbi:MAG: hypothetical protein KA368_00505 [Acidobacteria bacterium]|nr:hypothetical protein [Acidobacteriota bacterium]